jgi:hypothetical protein
VVRQVLLISWIFTSETLDSGAGSRSVPTVSFARYLYAEGFVSLKIYKRPVK